MDKWRNIETKKKKMWLLMIHNGLAMEISDGLGMVMAPFIWGQKNGTLKKVISEGHGYC